MPALRFTLLLTISATTLLGTWNSWALTPNDAGFSQQWALLNTGQTIPGVSGGVVGIDIGVTRAWDITTGSRDLIVAVIDSGIDLNNPDFIDNLWVNRAEALGLPGVDDDGNGYIDDIHGYDFANRDADPTDDLGHGTHVSGILAAAGNNATGIAGVAWNVRLMPLKYLSAANYGGMEDAAEAIRYAVKHGARIINCSWGYGADYTDETMEPPAVLVDAIRFAAERGVLIVAGAGNEMANNDRSPFFPATIESDNIIAVAAIHPSGLLQRFSSFGARKVHLAAPGEGILSHTPRGLEYWPGTSMATPHVSGVAALLLSLEPQLTPRQIRDRLIRTATPLRALRGKVAAGGLVNAWNALTDSVPGHDPDDPFHWASVPAHAATPHPYPPLYKAEFTFHEPGAKRMALRFSRFQMEQRDIVRVFDGDRREIAQIKGLLPDDFSPIVPGDTIILQVEADETIERHGFDVDALMVDR